MTLKELLHLAVRGGPGVCQIAVTNACNASCRFCGFPQVPPAERVMADPARLFQGLEALRDAGIHFLSFTGGEPLLYPELQPALVRARELGINTFVCTNGSLLTPARIKELRDAGLGTLIISMDAGDALRHDHHRGLPGLTAHLQEMMPHLNRAGLASVASVTLSRLVDDLPALLAFLKGMGFARVTFSYPITRLYSSYLGYADHPSVDFTPEELYGWFARIKAVKAASPVAILNPRLGLSDLQRQLRGKPGRFPCLAGFKYFFVDWHLQVFRCHFLKDTLGPLEGISRAPVIRDGCTACTIECYRDPSVFQFAAVSLADSLMDLRQGRWLQGLGKLLHPYNFLSLAALLEARHWMGG